MKKILSSILLFAIRIIPKGSFKPVSFWKHSENKYLYLCMSEKFIKDDEKSTGEQKFLEIFPKAIRISQMEFDLLIYLRPEIELVNVADDNLLHMIAKEDEFNPEGNEGAYAEDEHEESEDKNITNE
jgi:hypothetical protein